MSLEKNLVLCYNRGCGKKFDLKDNSSEACIHHPGTPIFHDAYKGWSCCNKKCIDFTEFLNIKGCQRSFHSNIKPLEPEKPKINKSEKHEIFEYRAPMKNLKVAERPPFDALQILINPIISPSLLNKIKDLNFSETRHENNLNIIEIGESCKNNVCKAAYKNEASDTEDCFHHPGIPIFHEGLKYWSCCQKKTTDFSLFLEQPGCCKGNHLWKLQNSNKTIQCRMDWHQTGNYVIISIYAKKYHPHKSSIKLNRIRITVDLFFPEENSFYNLDLELRGIVDVENSTASMLPTKVEIKLKKTEPGSWSTLDFSCENAVINLSHKNNDKNDIDELVHAVDLNNISV